MSTEAIKEKIAKLLAKAEGTKNDFEREAFMAKVNELLEEYQLEIWQVRDAGADPLGVQFGEAGIFMSMPWGRELVWAICRYYYVEAVFTGVVVKSRKQYKVIGRESCRVTAELMLPFVISQIRQQARNMVAVHASEGRNVSKTLAERHVANALIARIYRLIRARIAAGSGEHFAANGLILVDEATAYMNELFPKLETAKNRELKTSKVARELAKRVSLNHQATGKRTKLLA